MLCPLCAVRQDQIDDLDRKAMGEPKSFSKYIVSGYRLWRQAAYLYGGGSWTVESGQ